MKKALSLILSLLMVLSCMTCLFSLPASAEEQVTETTAESLPENIITSTDAKTVSASAEHSVVYADYRTWGSSSKVTTQQFHQFDFKVSVSDDAVGDIRIYTLALSNGAVQSNSYYAIVRDVTGGGTEVSVAYPYDNVTGNVDYNYVAYAFASNREYFAKGYKNALSYYEERKEEFPDRDIRLEYPSVAGFDKVANSTLVKAGDKYDYSVVFKPDSNYITEVVVVVEGLTAGSVTITDPYLMNLTGTQQQNYLYKHGDYSIDIIGILKEEDGNVFTRVIPNKYVAGTVAKAILSSVKGGPLYDLEVLGGSSYRFVADIRYPAGVSQGSNQAPQFDFYETKASNYGKIYESAGDTTEYTLGSTNQVTYTEGSNAYSYNYIHPTLALKQRRPSLTSVFSTGTYSSKDGSFADIVRNNNTSQNGRELGAQLKDRANVWMDYKYEFTGLAEPLLESHKRFKSKYSSSYPNLKYVLNETEDGYVLNENGNGILYPATDTTVAFGMIFYDIIDIGDPYFNEVVDVSVTSKGNGSASASSATAMVGSTVTFTAKSSGGDFLGWYNGDIKVSEDLVYKHVVAGTTNLTAKFTGVKVEWKTKSYAQPSEVTDVAPYAIGPVCKVSGTVNYQSVYAVVDLQPNTEYTFKTYVKSTLKLSGGAGSFVVPLESGLSNNLSGDKWNGGGYTAGDGFTDLITSETIPAANPDEWQEMVYNFTTTEYSQYIIVVKFGEIATGQNTQLAYLSDSSVVGNYAVDFEVDGNGYAEISANKVAGGKSVTYTAKPWQNEEFIGWYNGDTKVSEDLVYTVIPESALTLTAKFTAKTENLMAGYKADDWGDYYWSTISDSDISRYGGQGYRVTKSMHQQIYTKFDLKPNTKYALSFQWKAVENAKGGSYPSNIYVYSINAGDLFDETKNWGNYYTYDSNYKDLEADKTYGTQAIADTWTWQEVNTEFTTMEDGTYTLNIRFITKTNGDQIINLSDFVLTEVAVGSAPAGEDMVAAGGASLRKETEGLGAQAIRQKFIIDADVIAAAQSDGYELVEYGTVVASANGLSGHAADPVLGATTYPVKKGVAYQKTFGGEVTTDIRFDTDENGNVIYTAALYNIGSANYSKVYVARPYAVFENADGDQYVRYGQSQSACIFDVVKAILDGNKQDDIDYVNDTLLAGDIKDAYNAWLAE